MSLYLPEEHALEAVFADDIREVLYRATLFQDSIKQAPLVIVITAEYARAEQQYGAARAERLALIEAGQVAQNILLQAYAMGLAAIAFGAFEDEQVSDVLRLSSARSPLQVIAIGYARSQT